MPVATRKHMSEFGIEVTESLVWQGWEPGREYTKNITLKNVHQKTKKLKYRIPGTKFFITKYPQPIVLSSGKSVSLPITFRPIEKNIYEDSITFVTQEGQFLIPMKATLPQSKLILPKSVHFGMIAVKDQVEETFEMQNASNVKTTFTFDEISGPFDLVPRTGTVLSKGKVLIKATFSPEAANVYQFDATCNFNPESSQQSSQVITLEGIGKYPHLCLKSGKESGNNITLDFGKITVGKEKFLVVELVNMTPVNAPFQILQASLANSLEQVFFSSQYHGVVPRSSSISIKVNFKANIPDMSYADEFKILAVGTPGVGIVRCIGHSVAPIVSVKSNYVNFGVTSTGKNVTRSFQLTNNLGSTSVFQFQTDNDYSAFKLDVLSGEVKANSTRTIVVTFCPRSPINYYKKLICLIHNQGPLYINLFGTCHSEDRKPEVLLKVHLERYERSAKRGLTRLPPEELQKLKDEQKVVVKEDGSLEAVDELLLDELHQENITLSPMEEYFNDGTALEKPLSIPHASADAREIDFGRSVYGQIYQKTVSVTNHTKGKVTCLWTAGDNNPVFTITPEEQDILPLRSASFRIAFRPAAAAQFFDAQLEAYVYYKCMRDHRLVKDDTFCPPWCINVGVFGHTFPERSETFVPECKWDSSTLVLPPVSESLSSYKTMLLTKTGTNPILFEFETGMPSIFSCKPSIGLCKDLYKIIVFRMLPSPSGVIKETIKRRINAADKYTETVTLVGSSEEPAVEIKPKDALYFKPTCVGTQSTRDLSIRNTTRVPLKYQWTIPRKDANHFTTERTEGLIEPNQTQNHIWSFTPSVEDKHFCKVKLSVAYANRSDATFSRYTVRLIGEGQTGTISAGQPVVNFGNVVVGTSSKRELKLQNDGDCTLNYRLLIHQIISGPYGDEDTASDDTVLELDHQYFSLPARAKKTLQLTVFPGRRVEYTCKLYYELLGTENDGLRESTVVREERHLCDVTVRGVYPNVFVSDIRASGCLILLSKVRLWELFSLERFNTYLDGDPAKDELRYARATRHSTRRRMPIHTRAVLDFNFNSAPYGAETSCIRLCMENRGASDAEWMFLFPTDLQLEMEYWSQTGQFDEDELHEMFVMDNQLFSIQPRKGTLSPGESTVVVLTYSHTSIGVHKLPVLFKISRGREILLNFLGTTVDPNKHYLHFSSYSHTFTPLPIGDITPPIQRYQLYNGGAQTIEFQLDLSGLQKIQQENCNWKVLECLTPSGRIMPGSMFDLMWIFSPLEAKMYIVDVPIHVKDGESALLTFTGVGYDVSLMGPTMAMMESYNDSLPVSQIISVPDQLLYLSTERLDFGNFPLFSRNRRIIFLRNKSQDCIISFNWKLWDHDLHQVIKIEPQYGYIEPNETRMCKVTFYSTTLPSIYNLDIVCEVVSESAMAAYNAELFKWHERQEEKRHLFTITEKDLNQQRKSALKAPVPQKAKDSVVDDVGQLSETDLRKYNALPPIGSVDNHDNDIFAQLQKDPLPWPPKTFLVHLGIRGRTFTVEDFNKNFVLQADYHFPERASAAPESSNAFPQVIVRKPELETIHITLEMIIRDILVDKDFRSSLQKIHDEPIPYFGMISVDSASATVASDCQQERPSVEQMVGEEPLYQKEEKDISEPLTFSPTNINQTNPQMRSEMLTAARSLDRESGNQSHCFKRSEEVRSLLESALENTIFNIISEASCSEISLTARPRFVSLPPSAKGKRRSLPPVS